MKKFLSLFIALILITTLAVPSQAVSAATIKLNKTSITLNIGNSDLLKLTGTTKLPKWSSSNKKIVDINNKGVIKAIKEGTADITAVLNNKKYTCKVTVKGKNVVATVTTMLNFDELTKYLKDNKITLKQNKDYTTIYTLTASQQKEILKLIKDTFKKSYLSESPSYYKSVSVNDDFTSIKVKVDAEAYKYNKESDMTGFGILIFSTGYQQFAGIKEDKIKFSYTIIDKDTGKTIETVNESDFKPINN